MTHEPISPMPDKLLEATLDTPWKARNEIERWLLWPLAWLSWRGAGVEIGAGWACYGLPIIQKHRRSQMRLGRRANLRSQRRSNPLGLAHPVILSTRRPDAALIIGDDFGMTGGAVVVDERVTIQDRVWVGANTVIADTDFHPLDPVERLRDPLKGATAPITIEEDVFIGMRSLILKGVTIGARSVIGAGSLVTSDIPPDVIAAGVPAQVLKPRP